MHAFFQSSGSFDIYIYYLFTSTVINVFLSVFCLMWFCFDQSSPPDMAVLLILLSLYLTSFISRSYGYNIIFLIFVHKICVTHYSSETSPTFRTSQNRTFTHTWWCASLHGTHCGNIGDERHNSSNRYINNITKIFPPLKLISIMYYKLKTVNVINPIRLAENAILEDIIETLTCKWS